MRLSREQAKAMGIDLGNMAKKRRKSPPVASKEHDEPTLAQKAFIASCEAWSIPSPIPEYPWGQFLDPPRKFRGDYAVEGIILVEVVGGIWIRGHHNRGQTMIDDMERRNLAQINGWVVLEFTPQQIENGSAFPVIKSALEECQ